MEEKEEPVASSGAGENLNGGTRLEVDLTEKSSPNKQDEQLSTTSGNAASAGKSLVTKFLNTIYKKYFDCVTEEPAVVRCTFIVKRGSQELKCGSEMKLQKGTYCNLKRHLEHKHKFDIDQAQKSTSNEQFYKQATFADLNERKTKYPVTHPKQQAFDLAIIKYFALDGAPFDTVEKEGFRMLVEALDRRITIKSRWSYMTAISDMVSKQIIPDRQKLLQNVEKRSCHFSCDVWSSKKGEGILCIMAHYIGISWNLERKVILFEPLLERHTGDHIRSVFLKCLADFNVDCDWGGVVVTDNASNMKKAFNLECIEKDNYWRQFWTENEDSQDDDDDAQLTDSLSDEDSDDDFLSPVVAEFSNLLYDKNNGLPIEGHLGCAAHTLQLAINDGIKNDAETKEMLQYVNKVMVFFKRCIRWRDELRKICKDAPINFVQTRWNSNIGMLERFIKAEFFSGIRLVLERANLDSSTKSPPDPPLLTLQPKARELLSIMSPLAEATNELQSQSCTSSLLILAVVKAFRRIQATTPTYYTKLRAGLLHNLKTRMEPLITKKEYILSAILDPRIRLSVFRLTWTAEKLDMVSEDRALQLFNTEYKMWASLASPKNSTFLDTEAAVSIENFNSSLFGILSDVPRANSMKTEIDQYLSEPLSPPTSCPLKFWEGNLNRFKVLSMMARKFLAIPATSADVERIFSISGWLARARRSSITAKNVARLLMIRDESRQDSLKRGTKRKFPSE